MSVYEAMFSLEKEQGIVEKMLDLIHHAASYT